MNTVFAMKFWKIYRQIIFVLILCGLGGIFAGTVLENITRFISHVPGLIVLIPSIIAMKGNIFTTLGARLGSATHMGIISSDDMFNRELYENVKGSFFLAIIMSIVIGIFASSSTYLLYWLGWVEPPNVVLIILISFLATLVTSAILIGFTILIVYIAFKRGLDPDNITGPILATLGDFIALMNIFLITSVVLKVAQMMGVGV